MERGTRRLLHDIAVFGRISEHRLSAWERLRAEVGPIMAQQLVPADVSAEGGRRSAGSTRRRRRVA